MTDNGAVTNGKLPKELALIPQDYFGVTTGSCLSQDELYEVLKECMR